MTGLLRRSLGRGSWPIRWAHVVLIALGVASLANSAHAQVSAEDAIRGHLTSAERDTLYASLARDVDDFERQRRILKTVVRLVSPTVVHIEAEKRENLDNTYGRSRKVEESGSGVIVDIKGQTYVLTNRHVIRDAQLAKIQILLADGRTLSPSKVWGDAETDVAVMAVAGDNLAGIRIGNSDEMEIGDFVLAVGSPFGLSHSVTYGIISAKGRRDLELGDGGVRYQNFLQTDAAINPGNSGGPLINMRGELVGINTAIASHSGGGEGIGFSIPINLVMVIAKQLVERGAVPRAYLGVRLEANFSPKTASELGLPMRMGARIIEVNQASPAEAAQLKAGDVIVQFGGVRVEDDTHLVNIVHFAEVGAEVPLVVWRDRQPMNLTVKIGDNTSDK